MVYHRKQYPIFVQYSHKYNIVMLLNRNLPLHVSLINEIKSSFRNSPFRCRTGIKRTTNAGAPKQGLIILARTDFADSGWSVFRAFSIKYFPWYWEPGLMCISSKEIKQHFCPSLKQGKTLRSVLSHSINPLARPCFPKYSYIVLRQGKTNSSLKAVYAFLLSRYTAWAIRSGVCRLLTKARSCVPINLI